MNKLAKELAEAWLTNNLVDLNSYNEKEIPNNRNQAYETLNLFYKKLNKKTIGWKIGAVAKEVQLQEGFDGPVPGKIFEDTILNKECEIDYSEIPFSNLECEYAFKFNQDYLVSKDLIKSVDQLQLFSAIDITSSRYKQSSKSKFSKLIQMYLGISDHGNGGRIIIGQEIKDWKNIKINDLKIKMQINKKLTEPCFNGLKRIDPRDSLAVFIEEFTNKDIRFKKGDFLLCGSLTEPYKIKKKDNILVTFEGIGDIKIDIK